MILLAHSFYLNRDAKQAARTKPYPPLSTMIAAAILRDAGHDVALFDATFADPLDGFDAALATTKPAIVLIVEDNFNFLTKMCTDNRRQDTVAMIGAARRAGCRVAINGPDAADQPDLYLAAGAEAVIAGEGEFGVVDTVAALGDQDRLAGTGGLMLRGPAGTVRRTPPRRSAPDLDTLPLPAWDLVDASAYRDAWTGAHGYSSWNIAASRGCPFACNWCAKPTFGRRYTQRSAAAVADEMHRLKAAIAPDHLWFADDIFGMTEAWILDFAREVAVRGAAIPFLMQSRATLINAPVATALAAAGAQEVWLGIESGSQKILDAMDKGTTVEAARQATRALKAVGIRVGWFLQLGYPSEEWDDIAMTRDLVRDEMPDDVGVSVSYPLPGTVFHDRVAAQLGARRHWRDTADLAMLFEGTYDTAFYRLIRDALHAAVHDRAIDDDLWDALAARAAAHRSSAPIDIRPTDIQHADHRPGAVRMAS